MSNQDKVLARIFVDFDDIISRYFRFNMLFFKNIQDQIKNNSMAKEMIKSYQNVKDQNLETEQLFNLEPNENNLLIVETNMKCIVKLLKKYKNNLKQLFDNEEIKQIANNANDYLFGLQHLIISIHVKIELFIEFLNERHIDKNLILSSNDLKREISIYKEILKLRNILLIMIHLLMIFLEKILS